MESVYQPAEDSFLMLDVLEKEDLTGKSVLDMGTGSGVLAIAAAKKGCSVTAADINPDAIKLAKENAKKGGIEMRFAVSDLFEKITGKFDLIIFNPPYVRTADCEMLDMQSRAWAGGIDGMQVINRFLSSVRGFLKPGGKILLLVSSIDPEPPEIKGFEVKVLKRKPLFFETLHVLELS